MMRSSAARQPAASRPHHRRQPPATVVSPILQLLGDETTTDVPGSTTMRKQLTHVLFVQR
jgi:hypothetical protein